MKTQESESTEDFSSSSKSLDKEPIKETLSSSNKENKLESDSKTTIKESESLSEEEHQSSAKKRQKKKTTKRKTKKKEESESTEEINSSVKKPKKKGVQKKNTKKTKKTETGITQDEVDKKVFNFFKKRLTPVHSSEIINSLNKIQKKMINIALDSLVEKNIVIIKRVKKFKYYLLYAKSAEKREQIKQLKKELEEVLSKKVKKGKMKYKTQEEIDLSYNKYLEIEEENKRIMEGLANNKIMPKNEYARLENDVKNLNKELKKYKTVVKDIKGALLENGIKKEEIDEIF